MQQRRSGLRERLVSLLELPGDVVLDVARVTLVGNMELVVENHRGLVEYKPDRVVLNLPDGRMAIDGEELRISFLSPDQLVLVGKVLGLRYVPPKEGGA